MRAQQGSILDFLEVIEADFARLVHETQTEEKAEQAERDRFMFEANNDKALKQHEMDHMADKRTDLESQIQSAKSELVAFQGELNAAMDYYDKLKPQCEDSGITYEERVKRREAELQSLREAQKILQGEAIAF